MFVLLFAGTNLAPGGGFNLTDSQISTGATLNIAKRIYLLLSL